MISGSDSFHYYYNYAVGFVATIYTCFAKLASRSTVDWASMAIGGIGYICIGYILPFVRCIHLSNSVAVVARIRD